NKLDPYFANIRSYKDLPEIFINKIKHFFENYKALEKGKWVRVENWQDETKAKLIIQEAIEFYKNG
ncbi:inorganic diphosphatase, partial [Klebsiella pneumoniae]|uniref:inorganic diphosphatase n=1 Tax=Klebsiella pneumoniae TaxID=573 RepID=UPI003EE230CF